MELDRMVCMPEERQAGYKIILGNLGGGIKDGKSIWSYSIYLSLKLCNISHCCVVSVVNKYLRLSLYVSTLYDNPI